MTLEQKKVLGLAILLLGVRLETALVGEETQVFTTPVLRVAKLAKPPVIDGRIDRDEWASAAAFTALAATGGVGPYTLVPEMQQVVWYIGFDDRFLYLAMFSPHKKGTYPVARVKENDTTDLLFEDHVEIQICPFERKDATRPGKGFFKVMVNPKGAMIDQHLYNGTVGTEELWSIGGEARCLVTEEFWSLELSIEIPRLKVEKLDGRDLVMQLVRTDWCGGVYFAGWAPAPWLNWNDFATVDFDSRAPVFQFRRTGEIMAGELDTEVVLTGSDPQGTEITVEVAVDNAEGKTVYREKQSATVKAGESKTVLFRKSGIPISPVTFNDRPRNWYEIRATYKDGGREIVLYHNRLPFVIMDDNYREKYLKPWLAGRPQSGEWDFRMAYMPYSSMFEASVDLDFFGIPAEVQAARSFDVSLRRKGEKKALCASNAAIENLAGSLLMSVPDLPDGEYEAVFTLRDASGKKTISEKSASFERKRYPFEHNSLGINEEVIPPYTPMSTNGNTIHVWNRQYTIAPCGLPASLVSGPPTGTAGGNQNLLAAPMRLEMKAGGQEVAASDPTGGVVSAAWHRALAEGSQVFGQVNASVSAVAEYDGWYEVKLTLTPGAPTTVDSLDLVADLADIPVDTLYVQRMGDGRYGNKFGCIPASPGTHFQSTSLLKYGDWKSFVPITYVGNGDKGLWFFAWSRLGWELKDDQPMMQIERLTNGVVRQRVRFLAGPVELASPRTLWFAIQVAPVKPNDPRYRTRLDEAYLAHDTCGYRYYGDSVDGYALHSEDDYAALRKFLIYGPRYQNEESRKEYYWWRCDWFTTASRLVLYGSTWMAGSGAPEYKTFGGEWFGRSNWKPSPDTAFTAKWNYQGTVRWDTPEKLSPNGNNWTQSHTDFFVWYHKPLIEKCGINGTWWDNSSIGLIREYDPEAGRMDQKWNLYARRQLCKRLNHLGWELNRPPCWIMNMHVDMAFNQVFWMVENDWYADADDMTALQHWTLDEYRAMCRTKSTTLISKPWYSGFKGSTPDLDRKVQRSLWGIMLSHDVWAPIEWNTPAEWRIFRKKLDYLLDPGDSSRCLFTGYWASEQAVQPAEKSIKASFYSQTSLKRAVIVLFNTDKADHYLAGTTFDVNQLVNPRVKQMARRIYDPESEKEIQTVFEGGRYRIAEPCLVGWHEPRFVVVETE